MIKLIISDMDGTLLNSRHELPKDFMSVFEQLQQRGIYFCAASGRQYLSLLQFFAPVKDRMAFISENGAFVNVNGKEVYQNAIASSGAAFPTKGRAKILKKSHLLMIFRIIF